MNFKHNTYRYITGFEEPTGSLITNFGEDQLYLYEMALKDYKPLRKDLKGLYIGDGTHGHKNALHIHQRQDLSDFWIVFDKVDSQMAI